MLRNILISLWVSFTISAGFIFCDYLKGTYDRADVAVPMIAFGTAMLTLIFFSKDK